MDEPTPGELMRAIQETKNIVRELHNDVSRNYVRNDIYEERSKSYGERLGRVESDQASQKQQIKEGQERFAKELERRDEEAKKMRVLIWTSLGSPLLLLVVGIGLRLAIGGSL